MQFVKSGHRTRKTFIILFNCRLLYSVLPISVANELRHQRPVPAKRYDSVTLLFSGIVGFSTYCANNTDSSGAMKIVKMLNDLYTAFDVLTDPIRNPNVYKVSIDINKKSKFKNESSIQFMSSFSLRTMTFT